MKRVLTAVVLIPLVILALFRAPLWLFTLLVLGVALLAAREYFGMAKASGFRPFEVIGYISVALSFGMFYLIAYMVAQLAALEPAGGESVGIDVSVFGGGTMWLLSAALLLLFVALIFLIAGMAREPLSNALPDAAVSFLVLPYVAFTLGLLPTLRSERNGALFLLYLMLLVWCGDIAAYYVGRAFGKHKLAPRISPGKTWEGAIASVVGAVIVAVLLCHYSRAVFFGLARIGLLHPIFELRAQVAGESVRLSHPFLFAIAFAVCINIAAQVGDLVESTLKRGAGLKDSGTLLPGHGGVLDRIDALLFALPVGLLFYTFAMSRLFEPLK